jgi:hypothetical protein
LTRLGFRHGDSRYPFFWQTPRQPAARWHALGEGPVQYLADTPDGAWADFLRHEEIIDPADLAGVVRRLWVVELPDDVDDAAVPKLKDDELLGGPGSHIACQAEARRLRAGGANAIVAPSAALRSGGAGGQLTNGGLQEAPARDGFVWALFGARPDLRGWAAVDAGAPPARVLWRVRYMGSSLSPGERRRGERREGRDRRETVDLTRTAPERRARSDRRRFEDPRGGLTS